MDFCLFVGFNYFYIMQPYTALSVFACFSDHIIIDRTYVATVSYFQLCMSYCKASDFIRNHFMTLSWTLLNSKAGSKRNNPHRTLSCRTLSEGFLLSGEMFLRTGS